MQDALLVSVAGLARTRITSFGSNSRNQDIHLLVVKNSMVRRATEGTPLAAAFDQAEGSLAVVWGIDRHRLAGQEHYQVRRRQELRPVGNSRRRDGRRPADGRAGQGSQPWPSREEQLSLLIGQILGPGAKLAAN